MGWYAGSVLDWRGIRKRRALELSCNHRNKSNVTALEQIKLEKEYYEQLQIIQSEVTADLPKYVGLRDRHLGRDKLKL